MANFNFRLFLRPTLIGKIIIDRLTAEGADRQAEARRWIELGYMCEQAGFRLDGNTLFQAGRPATVEASFTAQLAINSLSVAAAAAPSGSNAQKPAPRAVEIGTHSPSTHRAAAPAAEPSAAGAPVAVSPAPASQLDSQLVGNLRNLAH